MHTTDILISKTSVADKRRKGCVRRLEKPDEYKSSPDDKKIVFVSLVSTVSVGAKSHPVYLAIIHSIDYTCTKLTTHGKKLFDSSKPDMSLQRRPHSNCRNGTLIVVVLIIQTVAV